MYMQHKDHGKCLLDRKKDDDNYYGPILLYLMAVAVAIPGVIIGYSYIRTGLVLWKSIKKVKGMKNEAKYVCTKQVMTSANRCCYFSCCARTEKDQKQSREARSRVAVIRVLIAVWIVFLMCWVPFFTFALFHVYAKDWLFSWISVLMFNHTFLILQAITIVNSCINPFLYAFMSKYVKFKNLSVYITHSCSGQQLGFSVFPLQTFPSRLREMLPVLRGSQAAHDVIDVGHQQWRSDGHTRDERQFDDRYKGDEGCAVKRTNRSTQRNTDDVTNTDRR